MSTRNDTNSMSIVPTSNLRPSIASPDDDAVPSVSANMCCTNYAGVREECRSTTREQGRDGRAQKTRQEDTGRQRLSRASRRQLQFAVFPAGRRLIKLQTHISLACSNCIPCHHSDFFWPGFQPHQLITVQHEAARQEYVGRIGEGIS